MYVESEASLVDSLAKQMNMSAEQRKLMEIFLSMSDEKRDSISRAFFDFLETARHLDAAPPAEEPPRAADEKQRTAPLTDEEIEAELANYRAELLAEREARSASEDGSAKRA